VRVPQGRSYVVVSKEGLNYADVAAPGNHDRCGSMAAEYMEPAPLLDIGLSLIIGEHVMQVFAVPPISVV